jgi:hypothetical protein
MISTISTTVNNTVTLGNGTYASDLTITGTGAVEPSAYGAAGVYGDLTVSSLTNNGAVAGGSGMNGASGPEVPR